MKNLMFISFIFAVLTGSAFADTIGDPEKIPGWVVVYESDDLGATVRGSLKKLIRAVKSGGDIKIATGDATYYRTCNHVSIFTVGTDYHVCCEITHVSLANGINPLTLRPTPYMAYTWLDTFGNYGLARASIYGGADLGQTVRENVFGIIWFAKVR